MKIVQLKPNGNQCTCICRVRTVTDHTIIQPFFFVVMKKKMTFLFSNVLYNYMIVSAICKWKWIPLLSQNVMPLIFPHFFPQ